MGDCLLFTSSPEPPGFSHHRLLRLIVFEEAWTHAFVIGGFLVVKREG